jgi:hypothetical protein
MPADYPGLVHSFSPRQDLVDTVIADNVNALQYEVTAVQTVLGSSANSTNPLVSTFSGTWSTATTTWGTVGARLLNIEAGLINGVPSSPYVSKTGGSTITTASNKAIVLQAGTGSLNLLESYSSGAALGFNLDSSGIPKVGTNNVLYVGSTEYVALTTADTNSSNSAATKIPLSTVTTAGDLILGSGNATVVRLARGTTGQALIMSGTSVVWGAPVDATKIPLSTITTAGDLVLGTGSATVSRLGIGTNGHILTSNGTTAAWAAPAVTAAQLTSTNTAVATAQAAADAKIPLSTVTTAGDLILGTGASTVGRLARGTSGQVLLMSGTSVAWGAPVDGTKIPLSTVTTAGDLIVGTGSATVGRIGIGGNGTILTSNGTTATWATLSTPFVNQTNGTVTTASTSSAVVRNIHTSTTTPVSGNGMDGDVWLVYT